MSGERSSVLPGALSSIGPGTIIHENQVRNWAGHRKGCSTKRYNRLQTKLQRNISCRRCVLPSPPVSTTWTRSRLSRTRTTKLGQEAFFVSSWSYGSPQTSGVPRCRDRRLGSGNVVVGAGRSSGHRETPRLRDQLRAVPLIAIEHVLAQAPGDLTGMSAGRPATSHARRRVRSR